MSKIDDLKQVYIDALCASDGSVSAGIAAVVRALRDEVDKIWTSEDMGCQSILDVFNEILDSDAGEKVAEATDLPTRTVQLTGITKSARPDVQFEPATDPAPAVCEWTKRKYEPGFYATPHGIKFKDRRYDNCGICGKPIKFTEAK